MSDSKFQLHLGGYSFDPNEDDPELPSELRGEIESQEPAYYIIQFTKSLTDEERIRIQSQYGLLLVDYVSNYSFLEKVEPQTLTALAEDPLFRASVPYQPAFKISPEIDPHTFRSAERGDDIGGLLLRAMLFPDIDPTAVAEAITESGASNVIVQDDREIGGIARLQFILPSADALPEIAQLDGVRWIEEVTELVDDNVNAAGTIQSGAVGTETVWDQGLHGEGQIIGILDSAPLDINHCFFEDPVNNVPGPGHRKVVDIRNASGTGAGGHATFVGGCAAGDDHNNPGTSNRRGGAWAARLVSGNRRDLNINTLLAELNAAATSGATIHSNSWHDNTAGAGNPATYNQNASDVDTFTWNNEDHLVLGSAGNVGEEQGPPGTAKNAICVAAARAAPNEMNFGDGNPGPTADGRRKPDLMAVGCGIQSATVNTACNTGPRNVCATSYATPHAAAVAALVRQYYTQGWYPTGTNQVGDAFTPSGALMKATLLNSCIDMTGVVDYPSDDEGWGLLRLVNALFFTGSDRQLRVWDTRNANGLTTGGSRVHHIEVPTSTEPLRVTLVWADPPALAGNANPIINNLNLEVTSPDGIQTYIGNDFNNGVTLPNSGAAADEVNNVEMVVIDNPVPGEWIINVTADEVNVGNPGQGYALVATAAVQPPNTPPVLDVISPIVVDENSQVVRNVVAMDPEGQPLLFELTGPSPSFTTLTATSDNTADLVAQPGFEDSGNYLAQIKATDPEGAFDEEIVSITVNNVNRPPILTNIDPIFVYEGSQLTRTFTASDPDLQVVAFTATGLPTFATFNDEGEGVSRLRLQPDYKDAGLYHTTITVTDPEGASDSESFSIRVINVLMPLNTQIIELPFQHDKGVIELKVNNLLPNLASQVQIQSGTTWVNITNPNGDRAWFHETLVANQVVRYAYGTNALGGMYRWVIYDKVEGLNQGWAVSDPFSISEIGKHIIVEVNLPNT